MAAHFSSSPAVAGRLILPVALLALASGMPRLAAQAPTVAGETVPGIWGGHHTTISFDTADTVAVLAAGRPLPRRRVSRPGAAATDAVPVDPLETWLAVTAPTRLGTAFIGGTLGELGSLPPDPSLAAGPGQVVVAANGRLRSFTRAGTADGVLNVTTNAFFASVRGSASTSSPKVRFDRLTGRWLIVMMTDAVPGRIVLASSADAVLTASTVWSFYAFDNTYPAAGCALDSPTLGVDNAALYIGVVQFCGGGTSYAGTSGFVVRKSSVLAPGAPVVAAFHGLTGTAAGAGPFAPVGVDNDDPTATRGYFVGVDNLALGKVVIRRVSDPGGVPAITGNLTLTVPATAAPKLVPHLGNLGGTSGYLDAGDDRLTAAMIRNGRLWTAHTIGVDSNGAASASATRNAVRWYEVGSVDATPSLVQSGTLFAPGSPASVDQRSYFMPSIAATPRGRTVLAANTAGAQEFVNAAVAERWLGDPAGSLGAATALTASTAAYNPPGDPGSAYGRRWGSHSDTVVDACDGDSVWSVQSYVDVTNAYALQVSRTLGPPPQVPVSVSPSTVASGQASVDILVSATPSTEPGFYELAGYACRVTASIPGVTVNSVTATAYAVTLNVSTVNATPGLKAVTVTNPDGQSVTSLPLLTVTPGAIVRIDVPGTGSAGQPLVVQGWAIDGAAATGTGIDAVHVYAYPAGGGPVFVGAATLGGVRDDIGAAYGARFATSGFSVTATSILPAGPYTIVAYAHSSAAGTFNATASVAVNLTPPAPPFGSLDTPTDGVTVQGEVPFTGWALDDSGIAAVQLYRSPVAGEGSGQIFLGTAVFIRGARPDVQAAYPGLPGNDAAGWGFMVLTNMLPNQGNGTFDVHAYAIDTSGLSRHLGTRRIIAANHSATRPFGTIDTPGQGETVSGTMVNFGWALVAQPRSIPIDGTTIDVYIDGVWRGHPIYNNYRVDIATLFPGLHNSNGAIGYFVFDTTQLSDGLHTIDWRVRDDAGQSSGLGSRFFRVRNGF